MAKWTDRLAWGGGLRRLPDGDMRVTESVQRFAGVGKAGLGKGESGTIMWVGAFGTQDGQEASRAFTTTVGTTSARSGFWGEGPRAAAALVGPPRHMALGRRWERGLPRREDGGLRLGPVPGKIQKSFSRDPLLSLHDSSHKQRSHDGR